MKGKEIENRCKNRKKIKKNQQKNLRILKQTSSKICKFNEEKIGKLVRGFHVAK